MSRLDKSEQLLEVIGAAVAKRRLELGLSQEEVASGANLHRTYISDVERGLRNISILTLERISDALDLPIGALFILSTKPNTRRNR